MHVCMRAYHTRVHPHHARRLSSHLCFYVPAIRICFNGHVRVHTNVVGLKIPATPGGVTISTSTATKSSCVAVCMPRLFARAKSYGHGLRLVSRAAFEACLPKSVSPLHGDIMHPMDSGQGSRRPVSVAFVPKGNTRDGVHEKNRVQYKSWLCFGLRHAHSPVMQGWRMFASTGTTRVTRGTEPK
jgi:hypothetical protein